MNVEQRPGGLVWAPGRETQWAVQAGPLESSLEGAGRPWKWRWPGGCCGWGSDQGGHTAFPCLPVGLCVRVFAVMSGCIIALVVYDSLRPY